MTTYLNDIETTKDTMIAMKVVVTADPVPDVVWTKNELELKSDGFAQTKCDVKELQYGLKEISYTLFFPSVRHEDTGNYAVAIKNKHGIVESSAHLEVFSKPEVIGLKDQYAEPFDKITYDCKVIANPKPKVVWSKNGENLCNNDHYDVIADIEHDSYKLVVHSAATGEAGGYTLTATNSQGETIVTAQLHLHGEIFILRRQCCNNKTMIFSVEKPQFTKLPEDQTSHDFAEVLTKVRVTGVPKPDIRWTKNGETILSSNKDPSKPLITMESFSDTQISSELLIKHFCADDSAEYAAIAQNISGETVAPFKLKLQNSPPTFEKKLDRQMEVPEDGKLVLSCSVTGSPIPTVNWFKNGECLQPSEQ